ncbi:hypothetical protein GW17_00022221 [Ensete ventricosum]|uniref:Uncharacterized protein n=1 Tax=Ensete ventricosum TaxID=4639 RepID=A0A444EUK8_ENSVE|nr:hypothetical protein GW17_00022221 [Ensete ventricosum]RZR72250.1 hypothetical protein BHM03_00011755 [Ensete ventricosum]
MYWPRWRFWLRMRTRMRRRPRREGGGIGSGGDRSGRKAHRRLRRRRRRRSRTAAQRWGSRCQVNGQLTTAGGYVVVSKERERRTFGPGEMITCSSRYITLTSPPIDLLLRGHFRERRHASRRPPTLRFT